MEILSSFVTISSGNGSSLARLSNSALSRSRCRFEGFPGLKHSFITIFTLGNKIYTLNCYLFLNLRSTHSRDRAQDFSRSTRGKHHTMSRLKSNNQVFSSSRFFTPTWKTNQQIAHDTNPWVFFFRLSLLFAFTSMNSESARATRVLLSLLL